MRLERLVVILFLLVAAVCIRPITVVAQKATPTSTAEAEVREAIRNYDEALQKGNASAAGRYWADEYVFINPHGKRLTRADRIANVGSGKTAFNSLEHDPKEEDIKIYGNGDVAVYTTLLTIAGQYSGKGQQGSFRGLVVWVKRDGRWQQTASQLTPVIGK